MKVYIAEFYPEYFENESSYIIGVFDSQEKAFSAIQNEATVRDEPALALQAHWDTYQKCMCYDYGDSGNYYFIESFEVE